LADSPFAVAKFVKAFITWWLLWSAMHAGLLYWVGMPVDISVTDSLVFNFFIAAACLLVGHVMQFYLPRQERYWYILAFSIFLSPVAVMIGKWVLVCIYGNDNAYMQLLGYSLPVRFSFAFLLIACMSMLCVLWYSFQEQQETEKRKKDAEALNREAELIALRRQLQPHFLFNSLNSISALVGTRPEEARNMIQQLSDFLRSTIRKEDNMVVTLEEELTHLQLYLEIEKVRFGHRLVTSIRSSEEASQLKLPALILQPIVENAIKFGLYDPTGEVNIILSATKENQQLHVSVENPFDPATARPQKGAGFGLDSVQRRLYLLFGRHDLVSTSVTGTSFTTTIKIPQAL
jgi:two-component sensor histidine kinase